MNDALVIAALIAMVGAVAVSIINGWYGRKAAQDARDAAQDAAKGVATVVHMVDGTQKDILAQLKIMTERSAGLAGEIKGRDTARAQIEGRQDMLSNKTKV